MGDNVATKSEFLRLWGAGVFGNRLRMWETYEGLLESGYRGPVTIRSRTPDKRGVRTHVPFEEVRPGTPDLFFGESAPDHLLILQGEFYHGEGAFANRYLSYSTARAPMRVAMSLPVYPYPKATLDDPNWVFQITGIYTEMLLKSVMNENSYDDFTILRDSYPGHVIEFGVYGCCLGSCDGRNTIIWEVRGY